MLHAVRPLTVKKRIKKTLNAPHVKTLYFWDLEYEISVELSLIVNRSKL